MIVEPTVADEMWAHPDFHIMCEEYSQHANPALPKPTYDKNTYDAMERSGVLLGFRAMQGETMIGFMCVVTAIVPHYSLQISVVESLFVRSAYRKTYAGIKLIRQAEQYATAIKSLGIIINCPFAEFTLQKLLPKMGYAPMTLSFFKSLCSSQ